MKLNVSKGGVNNMSEHISTMGTVSEFMKYAKKLRKCIGDLHMPGTSAEGDNHELWMLDDALDLWINYFEAWIADVEAE